MVYHIELKIRLLAQFFDIFTPHPIIFWGGWSWITLISVKRHIPKFFNFFSEKLFL